MANPIRPLKIMELQDRTVEVTINRENLELIGANLQASGATHVSIVSVMGTYRTGKSFLLQWLTRFLRHRQGLEAEERAGAEAKARREASLQAGEVPSEEGRPAEGAKEEEAERPEWKFGGEASAERKLADWLTFGNAEKLHEGSFMDDSDDGFTWRHGKDKHTSGIWMWSAPMVFTNADGRKVGLLLMDTQGAWDSRMSKAQNATLFGLTALLSSKLVFNMQGRIDETKTESLDYILTFAQTICNELPGTGSPFGALEFLIRDWQHYEDGATLGECRALMDDHLDDHTHPERVPEDAAPRVERLKETVKSMRCFGLPHPGQKVAKKDYQGELAAISPDFLHLLDDFAQCLFRGDLAPSAPLGTEVTCANFVQVVMNFAEAFHDNAAEMATGLREAFVKVEMMTAKEHLFKEFRDQILRRAPEFTVVDPEKLKANVQECQDQAKADFTSKLRPWKLKASEESAAIDDFSRNVDEYARMRLLQNEQHVAQAQVKLVASPVIACFGYFLSLHPVALAAAAAGGAYLHVKKWTTRGNCDAFAPEVSAGVSEDIVKWCNQRWIDVQAMRVFLARMTPADAVEHARRATQQVGELAAVSAAKASIGGGQVALAHGMADQPQKQEF